MRLDRCFLSAVLLLALMTSSAQADLLGTAVTGSFLEGLNPVNLFDPAIPTNVIPSGAQNLKSTTVVIESGQVQFGAELGCSTVFGCNLITAAFTGTQLDIHTHAGFSFGLFGFPDIFAFRFVDSAFTGVSEVSNTYTNTLPNTPSVDSRVSGDTITVVLTLSANAGNDYDAVFDVSSAPVGAHLPEPSGVPLLAAGLIAVSTATHRAGLFVKLRRLF